MSFTSFIISNSVGGLKPTLFGTRPDGTRVALIAADELPEALHLRHVPRPVLDNEVGGMTNVGNLPVRRQGTYVVEGAVNQAARAETSDGIAANGNADPGAPGAFVNGHFRGRGRGVRGRGVCRGRGGRGGSVGDSYGKIHCSFFLRKGECDYIQQGCLYRHQMPLTIDGLHAIGLRELPRWFLDYWHARCLDPKNMDLIREEVEENWKVNPEKVVGPPLAMATINWNYPPPVIVTGRLEGRPGILEDGTFRNGNYSFPEDDEPMAKPIATGKARMGKGKGRADEEGDLIDFEDPAFENPRPSSAGIGMTILKPVKTTQTAKPEVKIPPRQPILDATQAGVQFVHVAVGPGSYREPLKYDGWDGKVMYHFGDGPKDKDPVVSTPGLSAYGFGSSATRSSAAAESSAAGAARTTQVVRPTLQAPTAFQAALVPETALALRIPPRLTAAALQSSAPASATSPSTASPSTPGPSSTGTSTTGPSSPRTVVHANLGNSIAAHHVAARAASIVASFRREGNGNGNGNGFNDTNGTNGINGNIHRTGNGIGLNGTNDSNGTNGLNSNNTRTGNSNGINGTNGINGIKNRNGTGTGNGNGENRRRRGRGGRGHNKNRNNRGANNGNHKDPHGKTGERPNLNWKVPADSTGAKILERLTSSIA